MAKPFKMAPCPDLASDSMIERMFDAIELERALNASETELTEEQRNELLEGNSR